jgi:monovalent cation:H+ antiporter-2, CPA2 family
LLGQGQSFLIRGPRLGGSAQPAAHIGGKIEISEQTDQSRQDSSGIQAIKGVKHFAYLLGGMLGHVDDLSKPVTSNQFAEWRKFSSYDSAGAEMEPNALLFRDLTYVFVAAVIGGLIAWRLRLPLILGFVLGGIAISPFTPGPHLSNLRTFEVLAEVGVVLLMFSTGVEFSIPDLMRVKWVALVGAPIGILLMLGVGIGATELAGWTMKEGIVIGAMVSVASTMVLIRLLVDAGRLSETYGRVMIGITLMEDLAVICLTVVIPTMAGSGEGMFAKAIWTLSKAVLLLIPLIFLAIKVIPRILRRVKLTCNSELFLLTAIAVCLGTAALAHAVGFSVALGAFLAGLSISGAADLHEANVQLVPLRDAFVALFFVSLGTLVDPHVLLNNLPLLGLLLLLIVVGKFLVWAMVVWLFRYPIRTAVIIAAGLTQIGELSFVMVQVARSSGIVGENVFSTAIAASLISILLNVFIVRYAFKWLDPKGSAEGRIAAQPAGASVSVRTEA